MTISDKLLKDLETGLQDLGLDEWEILLLNFPQFSLKYDWQNLGMGHFKRSFIPQQFISCLRSIEGEGKCDANWAKVLNEKPDEFRAKCEWSGLGGQNWAWFLRWKPEFADLCDWSKLDEYDWFFLLTDQPQFADKFKPDHLLRGDTWLELLVKIPQLVDLIDWKSTTKGNWVSILSSYPEYEFKDRCDWSDWNKLDGADWVGLITQQPQFVGKCSWPRLSGRDWGMLLPENPQFVCKCDFHKLKGFDWVALLSQCPEFADKCDWNKLDGAKWVALLSQHPEFADKCEWNKLDGVNWVALLSQHPEFADKCEWNKLDGVNWVMLLSRQSQFADKCDWRTLGETRISEHPQFFQMYEWIYEWLRVKANGGDFPSDALSDWVMLLVVQPQFADKCDFSRMSGRDWAILLSRQPQFAGKCDWDKLDGWNWAMLLSLQPQFSDKCAWDKLYSTRTGIVEKFEDRYCTCWGQLLRNQPQFENKCDWDQFTGKDWALLLRELPQYAEKCDWNKLYEKGLIKLSFNPYDDGCGGSGWCSDCNFSLDCERGYVEQPFNNWDALLERQPQFVEKCDLQRLDKTKHGNAHLSHRQQIPRLQMAKAPQKNPVKLALIENNEWKRLYYEIEDKVGTKIVGQTWRPRVLRYPENNGELMTYELAIWLRYNYPLARTEDWDILNGSDWVGLLRWKPHLAMYCNWEKLNGEDWAKLLSFYPEFVSKCDWRKTNGWSGLDWALVIRNEPKIATLERMMTMNGEDLVVVLAKHPELMDICPLSRLNGRDWAEILQVQPQLSNVCDWDKFNVEDWLLLLEQKPQFASKRDWKNITGMELIEIFCSLPHLKEYCDIERLYESTGLGENDHVLFAELLYNLMLLKIKESYESYNFPFDFDLKDETCDRPWLLSHSESNSYYCYETLLADLDWSRLSEQDIKWVIQRFLKCKHKCKTFETDVHNLERREVTSVRQDMSKDDIIWLLSVFPRLEGYCNVIATHCDFSQFSIKDWVAVLDIQPSLEIKCCHIRDEIEKERQRREEEERRREEKDRLREEEEQFENMIRNEPRCNDYWDDPYYVDDTPVYGAVDEEDAEILYWNTH